MGCNRQDGVGGRRGAERRRGDRDALVTGAARTRRESDGQVRLTTDPGFRSAARRSARSADDDEDLRRNIVRSAADTGLLSSRRDLDGSRPCVFRMPAAGIGAVPAR